MPKIYRLDSKPDIRGSLFIADDILPFIVKRVFFIKDVPDGVKRGFHRHKRTRQLLFCSIGSCILETDDGREKKSYTLKDPSTALLLEPEDWHYMHTFSANCILTVLASESYDQNDYITDEYQYL